MSHSNTHHWYIWTLFHSDLDECSFSEFLCQFRCVNTPGSFTCICPPGYYLYEDERNCEGKDHGGRTLDVRRSSVPLTVFLNQPPFRPTVSPCFCVRLLNSSCCCGSDDADALTDSNCCVFDFKDINECDTGNNTCTTEQVCFNFQGGFTCLDPLQCQLPYIAVSDKWASSFLPSQTFLCLELQCIWNVSPRPKVVSSALQSVYVFRWEPRLREQAFHGVVPTHGLVVGPQCARRHLPDAGHHALPWRLLHLPDKVGQRWTRVLHEGEHAAMTLT